MMKITICLKVKKLSRAFSEAVSEYVKRLGPYCIISIVRSPEGQSIRKIISDAYIICIKEDFETISSDEFADKIKNCTDNGKTGIVFIVDDTYPEADEYLSLTSIALGTEMSVLLLIEQVYRAYMILNGRKYHK